MIQSSETPGPEATSGYGGFLLTVLIVSHPLPYNVCVCVFPYICRLRNTKAPSREAQAEAGVEAVAEAVVAALAAALAEAGAQGRILGAFVCTLNPFCISSRYEQVVKVVCLSNLYCSKSPRRSLSRSISKSRSPSPDRKKSPPR